MNGEDSPPPLLEPLPYHRAIVRYFREYEPEVWAWTSAQALQGDQAREVRATLLRETYRLDSAAHPEVHADCTAVMQTLGIEAPVTLYQAGDGTMNAALYFIPGEAHLIFYGPVVEKLSREERIALIGHELSHYKLWAAEDGAFHTASQILDHALAYPGASASHAETARLYRLHTELYADRGGALAASQTLPAISTLVKTMTGLSSVDADSYLRQAAELDSEADISKRTTHPEIFMRAQALQKWWRGDADIDSWLQSRIQGKLSMQSLDLRRQIELMQITRGFLARLLSAPALNSEAAIGVAQSYFPDWNDEAPIDVGVVAGDQVDGSVHDYLFALGFDMAMADGDAKDDILRAGADIARAMKVEDAYRNALGRDLRMRKRAITKLLGAPKES